MKKNHNLLFYFILYLIFVFTYLFSYLYFSFYFYLLLLQKIKKIIMNKSQTKKKGNSAREKEGEFQNRKFPSAHYYQNQIIPKSDQSQINYKT